MTYQAAASTLGVKPPTPNRDVSGLLSDLKNDIRNPVLWKAAADKSFATQNSQTFYDFCIANTPGKLNQPKDEYYAVANARGYILFAIGKQMKNGIVRVDGSLSKVEGFDSKTGAHLRLSGEYRYEGRPSDETHVSARRTR